MKSLSKGGVKITNITNYFVKDLMAKTVLYYCKWSIEDVFNCKDLMAYYVRKTQLNKNVYPENKPLIKNVETAFRLGGKGVARKPSNFPLKTVDAILEKYNINNNWYDFSCGWGSRLIGALKNKVNYFGTDPNYLLCDRLKDLAQIYKETVKECNSSVDIRCVGSENFIQEYENKMGLAFSSPPYFCLEDYKIGEQSYKEGVSYQDWLDTYMTKTIENIHKYLVDDGYFLININNFDEFDLVSDTRRIAENVGFTYVCTETLENIKRCNSNATFNDNSEGIMVFKKG